MEKKVLFIDDEASLRRSVAMGLSQQGYEAESCETGMKALKMLEHFKQKDVPLHCAVVDVRLPDIDGLKLLKVIKFNYPELPVIVITGYGSEKIQKEAEMEKADAYLEKPFTTEELARLFDELAPQPEPAAQGAPAEAVAPQEQRSVSAYLMLKFNPSANLTDAYRQLYFQENVLYCDAVKGEADLVLLLQAPDMAGINQAAEKVTSTVPGAVAEALLFPVETPVIADNVAALIGPVDKSGNVAVAAAGRASASSYVFLEIEKEKLADLFSTLSLNDQVVYCDTLSGKYDIALLLRGASFADIDNLIRHKIKPLAGVLRIKEFPIIKMFEM